MGSEPERSPVRVIIADAGPLIHLWEANCLHLLPYKFEEKLA